MMITNLFLLNELNESGATGAETVFEHKTLLFNDLEKSGAENPEKDSA